MGTSQRHHASVQNQPNWGKESSAVTSIAKAIADLNEINQNPPANMSPAAIQRRKTTLNNRISARSRAAINNRVTAAGGRNSVARGMSKAMGRGGLAISHNLAFAFTEIVEEGFSNWLRCHGIDNVNDKNCHQLIDILKDFISDSMTALDDTAARDALEFVMEQVEEQLQGDISQLENVLNHILSSDEIREIICEFFGYYVYCHIRQDLYEKIEKEKGTQIADETFDEIRDYIIEGIRRNRQGRPAEQIDWKSDEAKAFISNEFDSVLQILGVE